MTPWWQAKPIDGVSNREARAADQRTAADLPVTYKYRCPVCLKPFNELTRWEDALGAAAEPLAPDADTFEAMEHRRRGIQPVCPNEADPHRLPVDFVTRPQIVLSIYGQSGASKSHYVRALVEQIKNSELDPYLGGWLIRGTAKAYRDAYAGDGGPILTTVATGKARIPIVLEIKLNPYDEERSKDAYLFIFDPAGEDVGDEDRVLTSAAFTAITNIFVFLVPPPALAEVPDEVRTGGDRDSAQTGDGTLDVLRGALSVAKDHGVAIKHPSVTVTLMLAKIDRYQGYAPFPPELLVGRVFHGSPDLDWFRSAVQREHFLLKNFIEASGGRGMTGMAEQMTQRQVWLTAVGGTGTDGEPEDGLRRRAPSRGELASRAADPLILGLLNLGYLV